MALEKGAKRARPSTKFKPGPKRSPAAEAARKPRKPSKRMRGVTVDKSPRAYQRQKHTQREPKPAEPKGKKRFRSDDDKADRRRRQIRDSRGRAKAGDRSSYPKRPRARVGDEAEVIVESKRGGRHVVPSTESASNERRIRVFGPAPGASLPKKPKARKLFKGNAPTDMPTWDAPWRFPSRDTPPEKMGRKKKKKKGKKRRRAAP